jgi:hypothetical protein
MKRLLKLLISTAVLTLVVACEPIQTPKSEGQAFLASMVKPKIPADVANGGGLSLKQFARVLAVSDESVRAQALEVEIARQSASGAAGIFEPEFYATLDRAGEFRQTNAEQYRAAGSTASGTGAPNPYWSRSTTGKLGIEFKDRVGSKIDLFYEMGQVANLV